MGPTSVAIRAAIRCLECMGPIPMNGIAPAVLCHHCQSVVDTREPLAYLTKLFDQFWGHPRTWAPGQAQEGTSIQGFRIDATLRAPSCNGCGAPFESSDLSAALAARRGTACRACGQVAATRWADGLVQAVIPDARALVGEVIGTNLTTVAQPILFSCLQCGAGLPVDGSQRVAVCRFCKASSFLPDALWLRMHPAAKRQWFFVAVG